MDSNISTPSKLSTPTLSICIPTYNRADHLRNTLEHLGFLTDWGIPAEVVISDNASTDATGEVIEAARSQLPCVRSHRQEVNLSAEANLISVMRRARGKYIVYLADDDELIPERVRELVGRLEEDDQLTACYCAWESWNARDEVGLGRFYQVDRVHTFDRKSSLAMFEFLVQNGVFPEIAIYRTEAIQRVLFQPHSVHWGFLSVFRLLFHGSVRFEPEPFYRHVVIARGDLSERSQLGMEHAVTHLDSVRGGLEMGLRFALRASNITSLTEPLRAEALNCIEKFMADRADVASRISAGQRDFIGACEFKARDLLWQHQVDATAEQNWQLQHLPLAVLQTLIESLERMAGVNTMALCGIAGAESLIASFHTLKPTLAVVSRSHEEILESPDAEELLVVADAPLIRDNLLGAGFDPGRVILWGDVVSCLQV